MIVRYKINTKEIGKDYKKSNYINALAMCKNVAVLGVIAGRVAVDLSDQNLTCADLPKILSEFNVKGVETIELECFAHANESSVGVFPELTSSKILSSLPKGWTNNDAVIATQNFETLAKFFDGEIVNAKYGQEIVTFMPDAKNSPAMTFEATVLFLDKLLHKFNITGALHLQDLNTIVFQLCSDDKDDDDDELYSKHCGNYYIRYGENFAWGELPELQVNFNSRNGFVDKYGQEFDFNGYRDANPPYPNVVILTALIDRFKVWSANKYEGKLFPAAQYGLNDKQALEETEKQSSGFRQFFNFVKLTENTDKKAASVHAPVMKK